MCVPKTHKNTIKQIPKNDTSYPKIIKNRRMNRAVLRTTQSSMLVTGNNTPGPKLLSARAKPISFLLPHSRIRSGHSTNETLAFTGLP